MKKNFIVGSVWAALVVGVLSFIVTVNLLDNSSKESHSKNIYKNINEDTKQISYETNQSSVRTNNLANHDLNTTSLRKENDFSKDRVIEKNLNNQLKNEEIIDAEDLQKIKDFENESEFNTLETANSISFVRPIKGEILNPLSINELVYSKTLKEWTIHKGTDYAAQLGDEVYAIRNGVIKKIAFNYIYGDYIVIEFDEGLEALYSNITVFDALKEGDTLKQGQVIGYVAESFGFEVEEKTHLHFELKRDGEYISI